MKLVISHPTANNFTRALLKGVVSNNLLYEFYTSIAVFPDNLLTKLPFTSEIKRRGFDKSLQAYTKTQAFFEIGRMLSNKLHLNKLTKHEEGIFSVDSVYKHLDNFTAKGLSIAKSNGATSIYAYEDAALNSFLQAKKLSMTCIYDLPIAYWKTGRRLMQEEADRLPAWCATLGGGIKDSQAKLDRKIREFELADAVVVPSKFVKDSLPSYTNKNIIVSPFGTPKIQDINFNKNLNLISKRPLRVLFVGSMSQRKGLGDLFAAIKMLNSVNIELVVMGSLQASMSFYNDQLPNFTYEPGRANIEVLALMKTCDIFCLPSIVEGRALVMQEAMSQGLPLIITPNTGGEDLIIEGETGFLVPIRSPKLIAEKLDWCLNNKDKLYVMGNMAQAHAAKYTWETYADNIIQSIR